MNFYVISEENYTASSWYKSIVYGLGKLQKRKRLTMCFLSDISELKGYCVCSEDVLLIIGSAVNWLNEIISGVPAHFGNRIIVLADYTHHVPGRKYSVITIDISQNVACLYSYLKMHNKKRIALYGVNPNSASDLLKKESFLQCGGSESDCFYNEISLRQCYESFYGKIADYDGVICVNDYVAISLIRHINLKYRLFITSFGDTLLAKLFSPSITSTRTNFQQFGDCIYDLVRFLQKNSTVGSLTVYLDYTFFIGQTTDFLPFSKDMAFSPSISAPYLTEGRDDAFYSDIEIGEMSRIEKILEICDEFDMLLITQLLKGSSFAKIADDIFISQSTIKYKLKQFYAICGLQSKADFINLLKKYIDISIFNDIK